MPNQAAEKAVKAVLIARSISFPYVHDLGLLLQLARTGEIYVPEDVAEADLLTDYATLGRYPGYRDIEETDYENAITVAAAVVRWAGKALRG